VLLLSIERGFLHKVNVPHPWKGWEVGSIPFKK
jgi:hypothetical protein